MKRASTAATLALLIAANTQAAIPKQVERLTQIRERVLGVEQGLLESLRTQKQAQANIKKVKLLIQLQRQERALGQKRLLELQSTLQELETRRAVLVERIKIQQASIRGSLIAIARSTQESFVRQSVSEQIEAPRRKVLANLVNRSLRETEELKIDLADAEQLEARIQDEQQQLAYLFQDLREQEGILELNQQLQLDLLQKKKHERLAQLENYRKLKSAESQVERLIGDFNARLELERVGQKQKEDDLMSRSLFAQLRGKLKLPVLGGKVLTHFGRALDSKSRLYVFKKGIDISVGKNEPVFAVSGGKVAFSGELPDYGKVTILDHGEHFYSLCAHLGELSKKAGDFVAQGDRLGSTDDLATPVYFEIRARNIAVNPLQWMSN